MRTFWKIRKRLIFAEITKRSTGLLLDLCTHLRVRQTLKIGPRGTAVKWRVRDEPLLHHYLKRGQKDRHVPVKLKARNGSCWAIGLVNNRNCPLGAHPHLSRASGSPRQRKQ
jgi:hypothetical protein